MEWFLMNVLFPMAVLWVFLMKAFGLAAGFYGLWLLASDWLRKGGDE